MHATDAPWKQRLFPKARLLAAYSFILPETAFSGCLDMVRVFLSASLVPSSLSKCVLVLASRAVPSPAVLDVALQAGGVGCWKGGCVLAWLALLVLRSLCPYTSTGHPGRKQLFWLFFSSRSHSASSVPLFPRLPQVNFSLIVRVSKQCRESVIPAVKHLNPSGGGSGVGTAQLVGKGPRHLFAQEHFCSDALCVFRGVSHAEAMKSVCFGKSFVLLWSLAAGQLLAAAALTKHQRILLKSCV